MSRSKAVEATTEVFRCIAATVALVMSRSIDTHTHTSTFGWEAASVACDLELSGTKLDSEACCFGIAHYMTGRCALCSFWNGRSLTFFVQPETCWTTSVTA